MRIGLLGLVCLLGAAMTAKSGELSAGALEAWADAAGGRVERNSAGLVVGIDMSNTWTSDAELWRLAETPTLKRIDLGGTRITDGGLELLGSLREVEELRLRFAEFVTAHGIAHLREWQKLSVLDLRGTKVNSRVFEYLTELESLETLDISSTEVIDEGFEELATLTKLQSLSCGGNRLAGGALTALKPVRSLRRLDVSGIQRVDSGLWGLALTPRNLNRLAQLTQLESLSLRGATLADRGADRPGHELAKKTELTGVEALAALNGLRELDLGGLPLQDEDLSWMRSLAELRRLSLSGATGVDDTTMAEVAQLGRLEELDVSSTAVSGEGLRALAGMVRLKKVSAGGSAVKAGDAAAFENGSSGRTVNWWPREATE